MMELMIINLQNAWAFELGVILGATLLISLFQAFTWSVLKNILWVYSILEIGSYYVEAFLVQGELLQTVTERSVFIGIDLFMIIASVLPLAANLFWIVPDTLWGFAQKYIVDEAQNLELSWLRYNLSPFYYVPFMASVHVLALSLIRFFLNVGVILKVLIVRAFESFFQGG